MFDFFFKSQNEAILLGKASSFTPHSDLKQYELCGYGGLLSPDTGSALFI